MPTDDSITVDTPYTIYVQTQAASPATIPNSFTYTKPAGITTVTDGTVAVDIDDNMIPVTYVGYDGNGGGHWAVVSDTDIQNNPGSWYDYGEKQWANAVTVQNPSEYTNAATGTEVNNNDVLGYWVYIPRYAYKVQRRDAYNPTNQTSANSAVSAKNFDIVFETNSDPVKQPIECNTGDYQTCVKNQYGASALTYPNTTSQDDPLNTQTAWATHPAFTWGSEELNGFWIGKFETTGTRTAPTVKPNQHANVNEYIGDFYTMAWSIGKGTYSPTANGGNVISGITQNSHHLAKATSHMLKNSEWGAVAYLASSKYGAGITNGQSNVQINAAYLESGSTDADGDSSQYGATGCGPDSNGVEGKYVAGTLNKTTIESPAACGTVDRAYNGTIGQYASTTNNVYGVYDMSGGAWEYVMGNYSTDLSQTSNSSSNYGEVKTPIKPPYVDLYNITSNNSCTWNTSGSGCGGHALFETASWGGDYSYFVDSSYPWFVRGGSAGYGSDTGLFYSNGNSGYTSGNYGFRVALLPLPQG